MSLKSLKSLLLIKSQFLVGRNFDLFYFTLNGWQAVCLPYYQGSFPFLWAKLSPSLFRSCQGFPSVLEKISTLRYRFG